MRSLQESVRVLQVDNATIRLIGTLPSLTDLVMTLHSSGTGVLAGAHHVFPLATVHNIDTPLLARRIT